jgi:hypothetical protein
MGEGSGEWGKMSMRNMIGTRVANTNTLHTHTHTHTHTHCTHTHTP